MIAIKRGVNYFDAEPVKQALNRVARAALGWWAGDIRRVAKNSMKPAPPGVYSAPGTPPHSHVAWFERRLARARRKVGLAPLPKLRGIQRGLQDIQFGFDFASRDRVVGIMPMPGRPAIVPPLHEYGGVTTSRSGERKVYPARPIMRPAEKEVRKRVDEIWRRAAETKF